MLVAAFVYVALVVSNLLNELRSQHRASTYVTSMIGIEEALRVYAEMGGDDQEYRIKLHSAMREQYAMYLEALQMRESKPEVPEVDALPSASPA